MQNEMKKITEELHEFEKSNYFALMGYKSNGFRLWPCLRTMLFLEIRRKKLEMTEPYRSTISIPFWRTRFGLKMLSSIRSRNPFCAKHSKYEFVILSSAGLRRALINNRKFDVIYDFITPFLSSTPIFIESHVNLKHKPPEYSEDVAYREYITLFGYLKYRRLDDVSSIEKFLLFTREKIHERFAFYTFDLKLYKQKIIKDLVETLMFKQFLHKWKTKVMFVNCASYGRSHAFVCKMCKELGISVVEFQHGFANNYHPAYSYPNCDEHYLKYLPDYYLTFGEYWNNELRNLPVKKIAIGNPGLEYHINDSSNEIGKHNRQRILFISDGTYGISFQDLALELLRLIPEDKFEIVFRPHPGERVLAKERYKKIVSSGKITLDMNENVYSSLKLSDHVVGIGSTVIFEAVAFEKEIHILRSVLSNTNIPSFIGMLFSDASELREQIINSEIGSRMSGNSVNRDYLWERNWKHNLSEFLQDLGQPRKKELKT